MNCKNRYQIYSDGRTSEQRRTGKKWKRPTVLFGEKCFFKPVARKGGAKKDGEMKMKHGIYVGQHERTSAHLLMTPEGVMRGVGLHRLPKEERWDITFLKQCKGLPWEMRPSQRKNMLGDVFDEDEKSRLAAIPVVLPQKAKKRQFYVLRSDIEKHGATASCNGCMALAAGMTGVPHSDECRNRILELLEKAEDLSLIHI